MTPKKLLEGAQILRQLAFFCDQAKYLFSIKKITKFSKL